MNELEKINLEISGVNFVKSYNSLKYLNTSVTGTRLIELILSYQTNNQEFFMKYNDIGEYLSCSSRGVSNLVLKLRKLGYITTYTKKNYNPKTKLGGSSTIISVNEKYVTDEINKEYSKLKKEVEITVLKEDIIKDDIIIQINNITIPDGVIEPIVIEPIVIEPEEEEVDELKQIFDKIDDGIEVVEEEVIEKVIPTLNKQLPETFFTNRSNQLNFNEVIEYFFKLDSEIVSELKSRYNIDEYSKTILPPYIKILLTRFDNENNTNFNELFSQVKIEKRSVLTKQIA